MPAYSIFGWQKPCYLMQDGYADTFQELLDSTDWRKYGYESGNPKCANCMLHSGYEASAVDYTFTFRGRVRDRARDAVSRYRDAEALRADREPRSRRARWCRSTRMRRGADSRRCKGAELAGRSARGRRRGLRLSRRRHRRSCTTASGWKATSSTATPPREPCGSCQRPEADASLRPDRAPRLQRPRHGGRPELGSLGPEIRRAQGRRRDQHRTRARSDRLAASPGGRPRRPFDRDYGLHGLRRLRDGLTSEQPHTAGEQRQEDACRDVGSPSRLTRHPVAKVLQHAAVARRTSRPTRPHRPAGRS